MIYNTYVTPKTGRKPKTAQTQDRIFTIINLFEEFHWVSETKKPASQQA